jgi:hypothetical protein
MAIVCMALMAKPKVAFYMMDGKEYGVLSSPTGDIFISVGGEELFGCSPILWIDANSSYKFIKQMKAVKDKYLEWSEIAKNNEVRERNVAMDIIKEKGAFNWAFGGDWHFPGRWVKKRIDAYFVVIDGSPLIALKIDKQVSKSKQLVSWDPLIIVMLQSAEEIQGFIDALDPAPGSDKRKSKETEEKDSLFK